MSASITLPAASGPSVRLRRPEDDRRGGVIALGALLGGLWGALCFTPEMPVMPFASACVVVGAAALSAAAVLVAGEVGRRRSGLLLGLAGALSPLSSLGGWGFGPVPVIRGFAESGFWVVLAAAVLLYQHPRLGRWEWAFLIYLAAHTLGGQGVTMVVGAPEWLGFPADAWWPSQPTDRRAFDALNGVLSAAYPVDAILFTLLVVWRQRRVGALDRYSLAPVLAAVAVAAFAAAISWATYGRTTMAVVLILLPLPAAFAYGTLRLSRLRVRVAEAIDQAADGSEVVRDALRLVLRDPSLTVRFWSSESGEWVDEAGRACGATPDPGRWRIPVSRRNGRISAEIDTVAASASSRRSIEAALRLSGPAIENAGLRAVVRMQLAASRRAHARTVQAAQQQRRDLERDLHDGSQQRLHGLLFILARARLAVADDPVATALLAEAAEETRGVLDELRDLAHGLRPSALLRDGLAAALPEVVERLPLPVELRVTPARHRSATEAAAYFVICEALTNVVKHGAADRAWVHATDADGRLVVDVGDDGIGGADPEGSGMRGMADRVIALGGTFQLRSTPGRGTRVRAVVPVS